MVYNSALLQEIERKVSSVWGEKRYWFKNVLYHFYFEDKELLQYPAACLNDRIIDASKKLVCKELGADQDYQSVLNDQCFQLRRLKTSLSWVNRECVHALYNSCVKKIHRQLFACPERKVMGISLRNSLRSWKVRWRVTNGDTLWYGKNARPLDKLFGK